MMTRAMNSAGSQASASCSFNPETSCPRLRRYRTVPAPSHAKEPAVEVAQHLLVDEAAPETAPPLEALVDRTDGFGGPASVGRHIAARHPASIEWKRIE